MNTTRTILLIIFAALIIGFSANGFRFSKTDDIVISKNPQVKIFVSGEADFKRLEQAGLDIDHAERGDNYILTWLDANEMEMLKHSGISYQVMIEDWFEYYNNLPKMTESEMQAAIQKSAQLNSVSHSIYGSMGGYLTYAEVVNKLDSMRIQYPGLISAKFSIGNTYENRAQWTVRVSNSPNAPTGRPEVWFHSLIHAREPESMEQNIYFMYWLLENYNIDPLATYILRYRELYFTPVYNADGYEYNHVTNPNGGGFWRGNRKPCTGDIGTDLNRNFGVLAFWNYSGGGSSTFCGDETFRGDAPFSEPENQNARDFVNSRSFKGILSYHTFGNYFIRPWGYSALKTPDENIFEQFSADMVLQNHFTVGRTLETVGYTVRGTTDDWYYNDSGHTKVIAMTPEVGTGSDGFWPAQNRILPLAQSTLSSNIYFAFACGGYVTPVNTELNKMSYSPGESGSIKVHFKNKGLMPAQNVKIELASPSPFINVSSVTFNYNFINSQYEDSLTLNFNISGLAPVNNGLPIQLKIRQNDTSLVYLQTSNICIGNGTVILSDSAENGITNWTATGGWGISTVQSYSPTHSFSESPAGNYSNNTNSSLTLTAAKNISAFPVTLLTFYTKYTIDSLDNAYVEVSSDGGTSWNSYKYYYGTQSAWKQEVLDITSLANASSNMKIRFSFVSNNVTTADGFYVDNIKLINYSDVLTGVEGNGQVPKIFALEQNFPNPFNPSTQIKYQLPENSFVRLTIFDLLGREVRTLVNEDKKAGYYNAVFDASKLASGIYFYKLEAGNFIQTKKMILVK